MRKISTRIIVAMALVSLLVVTLMGSISYISVRRIVLKGAQDNLRNIASANANAVESAIIEIENITNQLENIVVNRLDLREAINNPSAFEAFKRDVVPTFTGALATFDAASGWVIFDDAVIPNPGTLSFTRQAKGSYQREGEYNVRAEGYDQDDWFQGAIDRGVNWSDPYYWEPWDATIISYSKKLEVNGTVIGVVGTDFFYDELSAYLADIKVYENGYVTLMSGAFDFLYHPTAQGENLRTMADGTLVGVADRIASGGDSGLFEYRLNGQNRLVAYSKLSNGWVVTANPILSEIYSDLNRLTFIFVGVALVALLGAIAVAYITGKTLSKSIETFKGAFEIGASGDLTNRVSIQSKDEFGLMGELLNGFIGRIHQVIEDIQEVIGSATDSNDVIYKGVDNIIKGRDSDHLRDIENPIQLGMIQMGENLTQVLDNVKNQAAGTEESLAGLEEILASSREAFEKTQVALSYSTETSQLADQTVLDVDQMNVNMTTIDTNVGESSRQIGKLSVLSSDIGGIVLTINEISEKTNLLALNAAIEAARAGDAGRGFAVVADEIRKLAEQTSQETDKITEIIQNIQAEVGVVQKANASVSESVTVGLTVSENVKSRIFSILKQAQMTLEQIEALSVASREQMEASEEITKAVGDIASSSIDIEALVYETHASFDEITSALHSNSEAVKSLDGQIKRLSEEIKFFKL